jgi:hypothetical protein
LRYKQTYQKNMNKKYILALFIVAISNSFNAQVVISQIYGGGGNSGATYTHDFIELFNSGNTAQNLSGWSVQYASSTGSSWTNKTNLLDFTLQPGQYYLIRGATGGNIGIAVPTPDIEGNINLAIAAGKVVLTNTTTTVTGTNPTDPQIVDKVGYGNNTNGFEGTGPTVVATTTSSAQRLIGGCTDTNDNSKDFVIIAPAPRNSATAVNICPALSVKNNSISGLKITPNPAKNFLTISSSSNQSKQVTIYNVLGEEVLNTKILNNTSININGLSNGIHIITINEEGKKVSRKLIIE